VQIEERTYLLLIRSSSRRLLMTSFQMGANLIALIASCLDLITYRIPEKKLKNGVHAHYQTYFKAMNFTTFLLTGSLSRISPLPASSKSHIAVCSAIPTKPERSVLSSKPLMSTLTIHILVIVAERLHSLTTSIKRYIWDQSFILYPSEQNK